MRKPITVITCKTNMHPDYYNFFQPLSSSICRDLRRSLGFIVKIRLRAVIVCRVPHTDGTWSAHHDDVQAGADSSQNNPPDECWNQSSRRVLRPGRALFSVRPPTERVLAGATDSARSMLPVVNAAFRKWRVLLCRLFHLKTRYFLAQIMNLFGRSKVQTVLIHIIINVTKTLRTIKNGGISCC